VASKKLEDRIEQLRLLRNASPGAEALLILRKALADRSNLIVAEAAKTAGELHLPALIPDLLASFDRLFEDPIKTDPKCWGKTAIVKTLMKLDYDESPAFLRGSRHIQMEPVWGGNEDAAPQLRAACFLALVQCTDLTRFEVLRCLVDAMTDPADPVRVEAVRGIEQLRGDEAILLLRLKARTGDKRPLIVGHVFDALLNLEQDRSVSVVAEYLKGKDPALCDEAALALGSSRLASALKVLIQTWTEVRDEQFAGVLLRAISSSRQTEAIEFLINLIREGSSRQAAAALEALQLHKDSPEIQEMVQQAQKARKS